jgi:hypothetical protein
LRILTMRGLTKTRTKGEGTTGSFRPRKSESIRPTLLLLNNNGWSFYRQFFGNYVFISCMQKKINNSW